MIQALTAGFFHECRVNQECECCSIFDEVQDSLFTSVPDFYSFAGLEKTNLFILISAPFWLGSWRVWSLSQENRAQGRATLWTPVKFKSARACVCVCEWNHSYVTSNNTTRKIQILQIRACSNNTRRKKSKDFLMVYTSVWSLIVPQKGADRDNVLWTLCVP